MYLCKLKFNFVIMVERILLVLKIKNLSPSKFADEIGIQRSSMSHIMSGRNLPSLDLILKILQKFNDINSEWLIQGIGPMLKSGQIDLFTLDQAKVKEEVVAEAEEIAIPSPPEPLLEAIKVVEATHIAKEEPEKEAKDTTNPIEKTESKTFTEENTSKNVVPVLNEIEKIVILYKNNTFKEYHPGL